MACLGAARISQEVSEKSIQLVIIASSTDQLRLVYHLFGHDVDVATAMNRPAIISYTELTLPFPSARELWLAPTAAVWRDIWTSKYRMTGCSELNLRDLLSDPSLMSQIPPNLDRAIARTALLQGLSLQVWEFRQQMLLSQNSRSGPRATTRLWLQSRQEDLYVFPIASPIQEK
jgi:hypothetical protein